MAQREEIIRPGPAGSFVQRQGRPAFSSVQDSGNAVPRRLAPVGTGFFTTIILEGCRYDDQRMRNWGRSQVLITGNAAGLSTAKATWHPEMLVALLTAASCELGGCRTARRGTPDDTGGNGWLEWSTRHLGRQLLGQAFVTDQSGEPCPCTLLRRFAVELTGSRPRTNGGLQENAISPRPRERPGDWSSLLRCRRIAQSRYNATKPRNQALRGAVPLSATPVFSLRSGRCTKLKKKRNRRAFLACTKFGGNFGSCGEKTSPCLDAPAIAELCRLCTSSRVLTFKAGRDGH